MAGYGSGLYQNDRKQAREAHFPKKRGFKNVDFIPK